MNMSKTMEQALENVQVEVETGESQTQETQSSWNTFNLLTVITPDELAALGRKSIEMKANKATAKAIKTAVAGMRLSDATELAVYMLKKTAEEYIIKTRINDAVDEFERSVPYLIGKSEKLVKRATEDILEAIASFAAKADALEALDKWYGAASVKTSDKQALLDCYSKAVGVIGTFYGPAIQG
jgi:hypothetical protein